MKVAYWPARAALLIACCAAQGAEFTVTPPATGYELLKQLQQDSEFRTSKAGMNEIAVFSMVRGYVFGLADAMTGDKVICPMIPPTTRSSVLVVVRAYLEQNTDRLSMPAGDLIAQALRKAFPCQ